MSLDYGAISVNGSRRGKQEVSTGDICYWRDTKCKRAAKRGPPQYQRTSGLAARGIAARRSLLCLAN
jgi:hypothetical protein